MEAIDRVKLTAEMRQLINTAPVSVTFGAVTASGFKSKVSIINNFSDAGLIQGYEFTLRTIAGDWTAGLPKTGKTISINSIDYMVLKTELTVLDTCLMIHCGGLSQ